MKNFEFRLAAQVAKFNAIYETNQLPDCLTELMLLPNSDDDGLQMLSILAATVHSNDYLRDDQKNDQFLAAVIYENIICYNAM